MGLRPYRDAGRDSLLAAFPAPLARHAPLLALALVSVGFGAVAPALAQIQAAFGEGVQYGALLVSGFGLGRLLAGVPAGLFVDRVGPNLVVLGGAGLFVLGSTIGWVAPAAWVLVVGRVLQGCGCAALPAGVLGRMMADADASQAGGRMALYQLAISGGTAIAPVIAGPLVVASGWRSTFAFSCVAGVLAVGLALGLGRPKSRQTHATPASVPAGLVAWVAVLLVLIPNGIAAFDRFAVNQLALPLLAAGPAGLDPPATGLLVGGVTVVSLLAIGPSGWLTSRWGTVRVVLGSAVVTLAAVLVMPRAPGAAGLVGASLAYAVGVGVLGVAGATYVFAIPGRSIGTLVTLYRLSTDAIQVVGPLLVGLALDRWGFDAVFAGMAALGGAPLVAVLVRRSASRQASR